MDLNSALVVLNIVNEWMNEWSVIMSNCPNCLSGTNVSKTFDACW